MSAPFAVELADEGVVAENNTDLGVAGERDSAFLGCRKDRCSGKLRGSLEGCPIPGFDRNFDHNLTS